MSPASVDPALPPRSPVPARGGAPAPVIFDDAMVHTDDSRIERMFDALTRQQAQDLLIIVCRVASGRFATSEGVGLRSFPRGRKPDVA